MDDELLDLVDANDVVIGTINRNEYKRLLSENLGYIRAVDMYIRNDIGQLWVPTRTANKTIAPGGLDYSVGGHVGAGETYEEALVREAREEAGIEIDFNKLQEISKYRNDEVKYHLKFFIYSSNETPKLNPDDFVSAEWLTPEEVLTKINAGATVKKGNRECILDLLQQTKK